MWKGVAVAIAVLSVSCALAYPPAGPQTLRPERPHPTAARIAELAQIDHAVLVQAPFDLRLSPAVIMAGTGTWVTCFVPAPLPRGHIRVSVPGLLLSVRALDHIENRYLVDHIPCGTWPVTCEVLSDGHTRRLERLIESRGDCNAG